MGTKRVRAALRRGLLIIPVALATICADAGGARAATTPGPGPIMQRTPATVTADALPTAQIDGVAWAQVIVGNTVYVGGSFAHARPAGVAPGGPGTVTRTNLLAYDLTTGALLTTFAPTLNGQVRTLAATPDGTHLLVGGDFTTVNGAVHNRIAEFSTATGALVTGFTAGLNASVKALAVTNTTVYAGGLFTTADGVSRSRLAAFQVSAGALTAWKASADYTVDALVLSPDGSVLVVGGAFQYLDGVNVMGIGAVSAATGSSVAWHASPTVTAYGTGAAFLSLATDGVNVYGTAYNYYGTGNLEGAFAADPDTGNIRWVEDCHGDTYGVFATNGVVYTVSHAHYCANDGGWGNLVPETWKHSVAFTAQTTGVLLKDSLNDNEGYPNHGGQPAPSIINWFPEFTIGTYTGQNQAAWTVTGNSDYVVEGGEFPTVNGVAQQGLVRFAVPSIAPNKQGPMVTGGHFVPTLTTASGTTVRGTFPANWDRDDLTLRYNVVRDSDTAHPVVTLTAVSEWWNRPTLTFTDVGLLPLTTYRYRLYAIDPDGNTVAGDTVSITTGSATTNTPPTAAFNWSANGLTTSFDGSASFDSGGSIVAYLWTFGDGSTASGATPTHTYSAAGSYQVDLTVTDNLGLTGTTSKEIAVGGGTPNASDSFSRTIANGWGSADAGGPWTTSGTNASFAVSGGTGNITMSKPGSGPTASLGSVAVTNVDVAVDAVMNRTPTGGGSFFAVVARRVGSSDYRAKVKLSPSGPVTLYLTRMINGTEATLATASINSLVPALNDVLRVELTVSGSAPAKLTAKVWKVGTTPPANAQVSATDSTTALSGSGGVGLWTYLSATAMNAPVVVSFDNFTAMSI